MDNQLCSSFAQIFSMGLGMPGQLTDDITAANYFWLQLHIAKYSLKVKITMQRATFKNYFKFIMVTFICQNSNKGICPLTLDFCSQTSLFYCLFVCFYLYRHLSCQGNTCISLLWLQGSLINNVCKAKSLCSLTVNDFIDTTMQFPFWD